MIFKILLLILLILTSATSMEAQSVFRFNGQCTLDSTDVTTAPSATTLISNACTVNVFEAGTANLAVLCSDSLAPCTLQTNPFTAAATGRFFFYAAPGTYDVQLTGGTPTIGTVTLAEILLGTSVQVFSVLSHGALCDGTTNDAVAIQATIDEAEAAGGGIVSFPVGTCDTNATLTIDDNKVLLIGAGEFLSFIATGSGWSNGDNLVVFSNTPTTKTGNGIFDMRLDGTAGLTTGTALVITEQTSFRTARIRVLSFPNGILLDGGSDIRLSYIAVREAEPVTGVSILIQDTLGVGIPALSLNNIITDNAVDTAAGIRITESADTTISDSNIINGGICLHLIPSVGVTVGATFIVNSFFDNCDSFGIRLDGSSGTIQRFQAKNIWFSSNGIDGFQAVGPNIQGLLLDGFYAILNIGDGVKIDNGDDVTVVNGYISGNGVTSGHGINIGGSINGLTVANNRVGACCGISVETQLRGILINNGAVNVRVHNNDVQDNAVSGILDNATATSIFVTQNQGYNPQGGAAITVTASPFTYTAGHTPETVYIRGGTVSNVSIGGRTIFVATDASVALSPNVAVVVTYSSVPTMEKYRH